MANILKSVRIAKATYDFTVHGGSVAAIAIPGANTIPSGAIVKNVVVDVLTGLTSGGSATVKVTGGGVDLSAATAYGSVPTTGTLALASSATAIKATSAAPIGVTIGTAALTAGKVDIYVEYYFVD